MTKASKLRQSPCASAVPAIASSRPRKIDSGLVKQAQLLASRTDDIQELRMAQAVLLPALEQMTLKAAAKVIGVGRALMKLEEEQAFLSA